MQQQTFSAEAHEHISLDKIGLPSSQLDSPPSKRNRPSLDFEEASSSDSSDPNNCTLQPATNPRQVSEHMIRHSDGTPWEWLSEWAERPMPMPAGFSEVCSFQQLSSQPRPAQHTADIVCGVEFSPDGHLLASAGVAKQVQYCQRSLHSNTHSCNCGGVSQVKDTSLTWLQLHVCIDTTLKLCWHGCMVEAYIHLQTSKDTQGSSQLLLMPPCTPF